jgi:predicted MFS family arabinose efflux permease
MSGPFQNRNFRRLFAGRVVTNVGDSLYFVAATWLVYDLTGDPFYSGLAGFVTLAPSAFQFLFGPLVDEWSIRRILFGTQFVQAFVVLLVPVAATMDLLTAEFVLVVMPALATLNQLVYPAQTAALPRILDDDDLVAANSAFSVAYQGVDMVANALGGVVVALVGAISVFVLDAVTFAVAATLFATVAVPAAGASEDAADGGPEDGAGTAMADGGEPDEDSPGYRERLRAGAGFVRGTFLVWLILGAAVVNFAGGMAIAAMPAYADRLAVPGWLGFLGDAGGYGLLMAAVGGGNFLGAIAASKFDHWPMGRVMVGGFGLSAVAWTGAILADWLPVTVLLVVLATFPSGIVNVQLAAAVQSAVPDDLVGRVSSLLGSAASVAIPVGSLVGGALASGVGPRGAMLFNGVAFFALAAYTLAVPSLRSLDAAAEVELTAG